MKTWISISRVWQKPFDFQPKISIKQQNRCCLLRLFLYIGLLFTLNTHFTVAAAKVVKCPEMDENKAFICKNHNLTAVPLNIDENTELLDLSNNKIDILHEDVFRNLGKLRRLNLNNNKLWKITETAFVDQRNLKVLLLENNNLVIRGDEGLSSTAFTFLTRLTQLSLSHNPLGILPTNFFEKLRKLKTLHINNAVYGLKIQEGAFNGLENLMELSLSNNGMTTIPKHLDKNLSRMNLKRLYLDGNSWNCNCHLRWFRRWFEKYNRSRPTPVVTRRIANSQSVDAQCAAPQKLKGNYLFEVDISQFQCKPKLKSAPSKIHVKEGVNVTFSCSFYCDPKGYVEWYKDGTLIQNHWTRISENTGLGTHYSANLTIIFVRKSDEGTYKCSTRTDRGSASTNHTLIVRSRPVQTLKLDKVVVIVGICAIGLVILLAAIGIIVYCFYGQDPRKPAARRNCPNTNGGSGSLMYDQHYKQQQQPLLLANGNTSQPGNEFPMTNQRQLYALDDTSPNQPKCLIVNAGTTSGNNTTTTNSVSIGAHLSIDQEDMPEHGGTPTLPDSTVDGHNDDCPVHGTHRSNYSPCPVHGASSASPNHHQSSPCGSLQHHHHHSKAPCPVHQSSLQRQHSMSPDVSQLHRISPPEGLSSGSLLRPRSPSSVLASSVDQAYIRASKVDDCVTPSVLSTYGVLSTSQRQHAGLVLPSSTGPAEDGSLEFYHPSMGTTSKKPVVSIARTNDSSIV